ncbi:AMP-binding protein [Bosea sp. (in: a-proteobacteria)]|jgi:long-chain acyl-CoA synthetase|uniref:AMP-binding protein n=1 Tax=Bosea sp. (in: a-proteobacteria) TaxID=1871050 RepID=UPI003F6EEFF8
MSLAPRPIWQERFPQACDWDAEIETGTIPGLLAPVVAARPEASAIEFRERLISYGALHELIERLAAGLIVDGVRPGDRVALLLPNTPWHPVAFFAVARCGATVVHLSALDAPRELEHKLKATRPGWLITTNLPGFLPNALTLLEAGLVPRLLIGADERWGQEGEVLALPDQPGAVALDSLLDAPPPAQWPQVLPDDLMLLQFTGGTTGLPKAAMLTHGNLVAAVNIYRLWTDGEPLAPGENRVVAVLPLFHIYALTAALLRHLRDGNLILLRQRFDVEVLIRDIAEKRATVFTGVPTMWFALLNRPGVEQVDFSSLRSCVSGGAPLPFEVQTRLEGILGTRLNNGWGMTETAPAGARVPKMARLRPGLIGVPLPGLAMKIVALGPPRAELAPGEVGEIAIRGPNVFKGYLDDEDATREAFDEGWFLTGDLGRMDEDGLFEIVDRRKNMIISGGFNVYPVAIEGAIYEHPAVREVIVIGIDDAYRGQAAKAFVTLKAGAAAFTLDELQAFLKDRLGRHEMPRALEFRDSLPRSAAGKLLAKVLIAEEREKQAGLASAGPASIDPAA